MFFCRVVSVFVPGCVGGAGLYEGAAEDAQFSFNTSACAPGSVCLSRCPSCIHPAHIYRLPLGTSGLISAVAASDVCPVCVPASTVFVCASTVPFAFLSVFLPLSLASPVIFALISLLSLRFLLCHYLHFCVSLSPVGIFLSGVLSLTNSSTSRLFLSSLPLFVLRPNVLLPSSLPPSRHQSLSIYMYMYMYMYMYVCMYVCMYVNAGVAQRRGHAGMQRVRPRHLRTGRRHGACRSDGLWRLECTHSPHADRKGR